MANSVFLIPGNIAFTGNLIFSGNITFSGNVSISGTLTGAGANFTGTVASTKNNVAAGSGGGIFLGNTSIYSPAASRTNIEEVGVAGVGFNTATDGTLFVTTRGNVDSAIIKSNIVNATGKFQINGVNGASGTGTTITAITVVNGLVTAITVT